MHNNYDFNQNLLNILNRNSNEMNVSKKFNANNFSENENYSLIINEEDKYSNSSDSEINNSLLIEIQKEGNLNLQFTNLFIKFFLQN